MSLDIKKMNKLPPEAQFFDMNKVWYFFNGWVVGMLYRTPITPNQITFLSLVFGLSQGGIVPSYAIIIREYLPGADAGTRVGFVMMCTIMGMAIGGWMSGWIYDLTGSYAAAFWNGIVWNFLNIAIVLFLITRNRKSKILNLQTAV